MQRKTVLRVWLAVAIAVVVGFAGLVSAEDETAAQAGEKTGVEGQFVRVAETDEGWVVVGYRTANGSVKDEWMLLEIGLTVQRGVKPQTITRDAITLVTPDHQVIPMATQKAYQETAGKLRALDSRANIERDSIAYFPPGTNRPCKIGFFADAAEPGRSLSFNQVSLDNQRACMGRIYFQVPGGIQYGNYNLDVKFAESTVRVPFQIMTEKEAKAFEKQWKEAEKEAKHKDNDH